MHVSLSPRPSSSPHNDGTRWQEIGRTPRKTAVQVTLRWMLQKGIITIPKSAQRKRITENADLYDFSLTEEEIAIIDGLDKRARMGAHPDHVDF